MCWQRLLWQVGFLLDRMPIPTYIQLSSKNKKRILLGIIVFWVTIGITILITKYIACHYFGDKPLDGIEKHQYLFRWILWSVLTPLIISFAFKFSFERTKIFQLAIIHFFLGTFILLCEFFIEFSIIQDIAEKKYATIITLSQFAVPYLNKYWAYISIYFLLIGLVNLFHYILEYRQGQKIILESELQNKELAHQLTLSQLQVLKMQIRPHFLFNTHQSILGLIITQQNELAKEMLIKLSSFLRLTLDKQENEIVSLEDELDLIKLFLDIQKIRFGERFIYSLTISEEAKNAKIPFLLLQPLVENAMIHGIEKLDKNGLLKIEVSILNHKLFIQIIDNGQSKLENNKERIGLSNVKNRLQHYYGSDYKFSIRKNELAETIVSLIIPFNEQF